MKETMIRTLIAVILLVVATDLTIGSPRRQEPKIDEFTMTTYQVVIVAKGPKWSPESAEVAPIVQAHHEYVADLVRSGRAHIAGPFTGESNLRGVYVLSGTPEAAKELAEADPGVKAGRYDVELLRWMGPEGWFQKPADMTQTEHIFFGFLVTGENTTPVTSEEQTLLMRGHLEYRSLIIGRWVEKAGQRRKRYYRITAEGRRVLASHRTRWEEFIHALTRVAGIRHA